MVKVACALILVIAEPICTGSPIENKVTAVTNAAGEKENDR